MRKKTWTTPALNTTLGEPDAAGALDSAVRSPAVQVRPLVVDVNSSTWLDVVRPATNTTPPAVVVETAPSTGAVASSELRSVAAQGLTRVVDAAMSKRCPATAPALGTTAGPMGSITDGSTGEPSERACAGAAQRTEASTSAGTHSRRSREVTTRPRGTLTCGAAPWGTPSSLSSQCAGLPPTERR